jgi:hypothetical protein
MKTFKSLSIAGFSLFFAGSVLAESTHLGLPAERHVALELKSDVSSVCTNNRSFYRLWATGGTSSFVYKVPNGMFLVVTDVMWQAVPSPTSFTPGRVVTMRLDVRNADGSYNGSPFRSAPVLVTSEHGSMLGGSEHLTAGVRIGPGKELCAYAISESESSGAVNTVRKAIVYGYHVFKD